MVSGSVMACSRLAGGVDELRRGRPPRAARPLPRPWLRHRLSPACGPARVRAGFVERGREAVAAPPFRIAGGGTRSCRLRFPSAAAGLPVLPKLRRPRACRRGRGRRLRVQAPIRRYAPRRGRPRRRWTGDSWWYPPIGFTDQSTDTPDGLPGLARDAAVSSRICRYRAVAIIGFAGASPRASRTRRPRCLGGRGAPVLLR